MLRILLVCFIAIGVYGMLHKKLASKYSADTPQVIVYGRDSCGITQGVIKRLKKEGISYSYKNTDNPQFNNEMWDRVDQSGIDKKTFTRLPAVDINHHLMVNASADQVMAWINKPK